MLGYLHIQRVLDGIVIHAWRDIKIQHCQAPWHAWQMRRGLGLRDDDAPTTPDIVEGRNMSRAVRALWDVAKACISRGIQAGTPAICKCTIVVGLNFVVNVGSVTLWTEGVHTLEEPAHSCSIGARDAPNQKLTCIPTSSAA